MRIFWSALLLSLLLVGSLPAQTNNSGTSQTKQQLYEEGLTALKANDYVGARKAFEGVLKNNPNDALAHNLLGWVLMTQGETKLAVQHLRTAVRLKPEMMEAHLALNWVYRSVIDSAYHWVKYWEDRLVIDLVYHLVLSSACRFQNERTDQETK